MADGREFDPLQDDAGDELWLVSYADLLTLLIGFFVLLIAGSQAQPERLEQVAASITGEAPAPSPMAILRGRVEELVAREGLAAHVVARAEADALGIEVRDGLLFESGSADVRPEARDVLGKFARLLADVPAGRPIVIEGHTDELPIRTRRFASNWELSTQRAINVLALLEANGVTRDRMSVRGFADTKPLLVDGAPEARRLANRRVVIRVE